jgi:Fic family protein
LAFYAALQDVRQAGMDLTGWLEFFVTGLSTQLQEVRAKGEQAIRADVIAAANKLNVRQTSLVAAFLERTSLSLADCEKLLPDVTRRTLQRDLKLLVEAGLVVEAGHGPTDPTRHYRWLGGQL